MSDSAPEYPLLAIDTASRRTWVGLKLGPNQLISKSEEQDPSKSLFRLVERMLEQVGLSLNDLASILFCAGPGSMLGTRTASMSVRTWKGIGIQAAKNVYSYNSLQIGAMIAEKSKQAPDKGLVITDARRMSWNSLSYPLSKDSELSLIANEDLETLNPSCVTFSEFPTWTKTAVRLTTLDYDPTPIFEGEDFRNLISKEGEATPLTTRHNEFKKWTAKIHSTPEA